MTDNLTITCADDFENELSDGLRVGAVLTLKGKLEAVRYARKGGQRHVRGMDGPYLMLTFSDWSELYPLLADDATARGVRIPLSSQVVVKAMLINEDGDLMAIAIWENGPNPVPIALSPDGLINLSRTTVP